MDRCCAFKRRRCVETCERSPMRRSWSAHLRGMFRFSIFWNLETGFLLYFPRFSSEMISTRRKSLMPSAKSDCRCRLTHAVKDLICIFCRAAYELHRAGRSAGLRWGIRHGCDAPNCVQVTRACACAFASVLAERKHRFESGAWTGCRSPNQRVQLTNFETHNCPCAAQ
eukprot:6214605-Pleurochrysis_carterae.AAC.2